MSAISDKYTQLGGAAGFLGASTTGELPAANGGLKQEFRSGSIYWRPPTGAFEVHGTIRARWLELGAESAAFGYPTSDESACSDGSGRFNEFEHGSIFWQQDTGAYAAFFHSMLAEGVYLPPSAYEAWFVSSAHDDRAVSTIIDALPAAASAAAAAGGY